MNRSEVLTIGFGKAGSQLHLPNWLAEEQRVAGFDTQTDRLEIVNLGKAARAALESDNLRLIDSLADAGNPDIVDIATASGTHINAIEQVLEAGVSPRAWLVEKPFDASTHERQDVLAMFAERTLDPNTMFVNENYNASAGVEKAKSLIEAERTAGNPVVGVDVVFYKNRVPDVRKGRFTDPTLGAFGIEMPHMIAVAYNLADVPDNESIDVMESTQFNNVDGIEGSDATYVVAQSANGVMIRMAQGLGPFTMDADGTMTAHEDTESNPLPIIRYSTVTLADGRQITVKFDPVPGIERYTSQVEWTDRNGNEQIEVMSDNTLRRVIGGVVLFSKTGVRPSFTRGLSVGSAMKYVDDLNTFHDIALDEQLHQSRPLS